MASLLHLDAQLYRWAAQFRSAEIGRPILASVIVDPDGVISATDGYRAIAIPGAATWLAGPRRVMIRGAYFPRRAAKDLTISIPDDVTEPTICPVHCDGKDGGVVLVEDGAIGPDIRVKIYEVYNRWTRRHTMYPSQADDHMRLDTAMGPAFVYEERRGRESVRHIPQLRFSGAEESILVTYPQARAVGIWAPCAWRVSVTVDSDDEWLTNYSPMLGA